MHIRPGPLKIMENVHLKTVVFLVWILCLPPTRGTYEQCLTSLRNTVVYEGTENTMMACAADDTGTAWSVRPSSDPITPYQITNYSDVVNRTLTGSYAIDETGLIVLEATGNKTGAVMSTAGEYTVEFANSTNKIAVKLVVVRSGPTCSCNQSATGNVNMSCTVIYADHQAAPINAVMKWTKDGQPYTTSKPIRTFSYPNVWNSTATISVPDSASSTYDCTVTFALAQFPSPSYLVKNSPNFSASCTVCGTTTTATAVQTTTTGIATTGSRLTYEQCQTSLRNTVVYEGTLNTMLSCPVNSNGVSWSVRPTSNSSLSFPINNPGGGVSSTLAGLYATDETGLIVLNATTNKTEGSMATAGMYTTAFANSTNQIAAKLVVIRSGPTCSCKLLTSTSVSVSCSVIYADHPVSPINAVMNWTVDGQFYTTNKPTRTLITPYVWNSTSTITAPYSDSSTFDCTTTFAAPPSANPPYLQTNAPDFSATCTACGRITTAPTTEELTTTEPISTMAEETTTRPTTRKPPSTTARAISTAKPKTTARPVTTAKPKTTARPLTTAKPKTTARPLTTAKPKTTAPPLTTAKPKTTARPLTTAKPKTTARPLSTTKRPRTYVLITTKSQKTTRQISTSKPPTTWTTTTKRSTTGCGKTIYEECVVKAEFFDRCEGMYCGVVVTINNGSRWLIHDFDCTDNRCKMGVFRGSSMSRDWKFLNQKQVRMSRVSDFVRAGDSARPGRYKTDCSESCRRMMKLP